MNVAVASSAAVGAAGLFALATAVHTRALRDVERRITGSAGGSVPSGTGPGLRVVTHAVSSRLWLAGSAIAVVAFSLHALALHDGNLTLVQPLLVTTVLFALPASRAVSGTPVSRAQSNGRPFWSSRWPASSPPATRPHQPTTASTPGPPSSPRSWP